MDFVSRLFRTKGALRRWAVASLVANMAIVVTGAIVRVTSSGLGCPTWPKCFPDSYVATPESGLHGAIEFGNRLLTFVLVAVAVGTFVASLLGPLVGQARRRFRGAAVLAGLGIPLQAVVGGFSVLFALNPYIVALHMLLSVAIIVACVVAVHIAFSLPARPTNRAGRILVTSAFHTTWVVVVLGTLVTGAGPHSGDGGAKRNGIDLESIAHLHAWAVWLLVALTIAAWWATRSAAVGALLAVELAQGLVGYLQYFNHLPPALVVTHLLGVAASTATATNAYLLHGRKAVDRQPEPNPALVG